MPELLLRRLLLRLLPRKPPHRSPTLLPTLPQPAMLNLPELLLAPQPLVRSLLYLIYMKTVQLTALGALPASAPVSGAAARKREALRKQAPALTSDDQEEELDLISGDF
jgi:hypothetical protein